MKLKNDKLIILVAILSLLLIWSVIGKSQTYAVGDITDDGKVDFQDAIAALQILVQMSPATPVNLSGDVNGDSRIGLEEAIHALQVVAGRYNHPPELNPIGNKTVDENSELSFSISGDDADGDTLTYSASDLPDGATFDPSTREFSWTPADSQGGAYNVTFMVTCSLSIPNVAATVARAVCGSCVLAHTSQLPSSLTIAAAAGGSIGACARYGE